MAITSFYTAKLTIGVFSIERYLAICHPFLVNLQLTKVSRAIKASLVAWLIGFSCALPGSVKFILLHQKNGENRCTLFREKMTKESLYAVGVASMAYFVVPVLIIGFMYLRIALTLRRSSKSIKSSCEGAKQRAPKLLCWEFNIF